MLVAIGALALPACAEKKKDDKSVASDTPSIMPSGSTAPAPVPEKPKLKRIPHTLAAGGLHACAIAADKSLKCWGENSYGQLGQGTDGAGRKSETATLVSLGDVRDVVAGAAHTCVITGDDGIISCWGKNDWGQAGGEHRSDKAQSLPTKVKYDLHGVATAPGNGHSCAALKDGTAACWGLGFSGEFGNGESFIMGTAPKPVMYATDIVDIASGGSAYSGHTCALLGSGKVRCWGSNRHGEWGNGTVEEKTPKASPSATASASASAAEKKEKLPPPDPIPNLDGVVQVAASLGGACALLATGEVKCWGDVGPLVLEDSKNGDPILEPRLVKGLSKAKQISIGIGHGCAVVEGGKVTCWGVNSEGQLGRPIATGKDTPRFLEPAEVAGITDATEVVAGFSFTCARTKTAVLCWGDNESHQLGSKTPKSRATPEPIAL